MSETLPAIDLQTLMEVVRLDQRDPEFLIHDVNTAPLSNKGISNPDGLIRLSGQGQGVRGAAFWEIVVKRIRKPSRPREATERMLREARLAQSGFFDHLPPPLATPRIYTVREDAAQAEIWMERVHESAQPHWSLDDFTFAAREIGRFNAACLNFDEFNQQPWLSRQLFKGLFDDLAAIPAEQVWSNPYVQAAISADLRVRQQRLLDDREHFFRVIDCLPQVISHNDLQRRNLLIRRKGDGSRELLALDWAMTGLSPLGADLYALVGASAILFELDPPNLAAYEAAIYAAYLDGLGKSGWQGNPDEIRLAYTTCLSVWLGNIPAALMIWSSADMIPEGRQQFGCSPEDYAAGWAKVFRFGLDRADEARRLMDKLNLP